MDDFKRQVTFVLGIIIVASFPLFYLKLYKDIQARYLNLKMVGLISQTQLEQQLVLSDDLINTNSSLISRVSLLEENLDKTKKLLASVEEENMQMQKKFDLLDQMTDLQQTITDLKDQNLKIELQMEQMKSMQSVLDVRKPPARQVGQADVLIQEYADQIHDLKVKMRKLKSAERAKKRKAQSERDQMYSLMGNNGYIVREGKSSPMEIPVQKAGHAAKIQVQIVK